MPEVSGNEWAYVKECLDSGWLSAGSFVSRFEAAFEELIGGHAVATSSGTAALHVALLIAGVEPDDEVVVSTLSFIAPANAVRYAGAWPVFVDAERRTWQIDPELVSDFLGRACRWDGKVLRNRESGRRVAAVLPVHVLGHPVDAEPIIEAARRYGLPVIEDATESLGATYRDRSVGSLGDVACFSFNGNKLITTGGGGMVVTTHREWAERARYLTTQAKDDPMEYVHGVVGFNYRLSNLQAAAGCAQLERLDEFLAAKRAIARRYEAGLENVPGVHTMPEAAWARSAHWLSTVLIDPDVFGTDSRSLIAHLRSTGVEARPLWQPLHRSAAHRHSVCAGGAVAEWLHAQAVSLPSSVGLADADQGQVIAAVAACGQPAI